VETSCVSLLKGKHLRLDEELQARILVGLRVMTSQGTLADRVQALEASVSTAGSLKLHIPL
jgi:hypothetical protein